MRHNSAGAARLHSLALLVILTLTSSTWARPKYRIVHTFTGGVDGGGGTTGETLDNAGNLYGVSGYGKYGLGIAFELSPSGSGWRQTILYNFCPGEPNYYCTGAQTPL